MQVHGSQAPGKTDSSLTAALEAYHGIQGSAFMGWDGRGGLFFKAAGATGQNEDSASSERRLRGPTQLWHRATPTSPPRQLTRFANSVESYLVPPHEAVTEILYLKDYQGDEAYGLYRLELSADKNLGVGVSLDTGAGRITSPVWHASQRQLAYTFIPEGSPDWKIRLWDGDTVRTVLERPGIWFPMDFQSRGSHLMLGEVGEANQVRLHVLDLRTGHLQPLLGGSWEGITQAFWLKSKVAKAVSPLDFFFISDRGGEFHELYRYHARGDSVSALSPDLRHDILWASLPPDGFHIYFASNQEGIARVHRQSTSPGAQEREYVDLPQGIIDGIGFAPSGRRFAFTLNDFQTPNDVYSFALDSGIATRWTDWRQQVARVPALSKPLLVRIPTFDSAGAGSRQIPGWLYLPTQNDNDTVPPPLLIHLHGGPELQARPGFEPLIQMLVHHLGIAVLAPNVRGSAGYGKAYLELDDGNKRADVLRDLSALLDWAQSRKDLDPARVAAMGRSYGGFLALSLAVMESGRPGRLRAAVSTAGITDFPSFLENTSAYRRDLRRAEYGDERDPKMRRFLVDISPMTRRHDIGIPLLLCHGDSDPRVPSAESTTLFHSLKGRGVSTWLLTFSDEGHVFREAANVRFYHATVAKFLDRFLVSGP